MKKIIFYTEFLGIFNQEKSFNMIPTGFVNGTNIQAP